MGADTSGDGAFDPVAKRVAEFVMGRVPGEGGEGLPPSGAGVFQQRLTRFRQSRRSRKWLVVGTASAVTVLVGAIVASRFGEHRLAADLSYTVDGARPSPGGYVPVSESSTSLLAFSDGSHVTMSARARGRVTEVNRRGARFALEQGKVSVQIIHRPRTQWIFEAGPFLVTVHGTSFTIAWNPTDAVFEMRLQSGAVSVTGPLPEREVRLRTGQVLRVNLRDQTSTIGTAGLGPAPKAEKTKNETTDETTEVVPSSTAPSTAPPPPQMRPSSSPRWAHRDWAVAVAEGGAIAVLSEADRRGLSAVLDQAASEDLWALANAARYVGRYSLARQALTAQRRRFPSSNRAREAAFLLGRLDDGATAGPEDALQWYDRYLAEAPNGTHASDALGRKMTVLQRWNRRDEALTVARDYLRRFPRGVYSNAARALIRAHR